MKKKPLLIIVSGAPGSGKTTLAKQLAEKLQFMHVDTDIVMDSMWQANKHDPNYQRGEDGFPRVFDLIKDILAYDVNVVADRTIYKNKSEVLLRSMSEAAQLVNVHCRSKNEHERFYRRELLPDGSEPDWLGPQMPHLEKIYPDVVDPLDLGCPLIEVDTNDGYKPRLDEIVEKIKSFKE